MHILIDFSELNTIEEYEEKVLKRLKDIDVGILALNAGIGGTDTSQPFVDNNTIEDQLNINVLHVTYISKVLLPKLSSRNSKSAIILLSSICATRPFPSMITYSATKNFVTNFGKMLSFEMKNKIDTIVYEPGAVDTNMLKFAGAGIG